MATKNNDIFVQINDKVIKLEGAEKETYLAELDARNEKVKFEKAEIEAKAAAKAAAQAKLVALGLTVEDLQALGLQHNLREQ